MAHGAADVAGPGRPEVAEAPSHCFGADEVRQEYNRYRALDPDAAIMPFSVHGNELKWFAEVEGRLINSEVFRAFAFEIHQGNGVIFKFRPNDEYSTCPGFVLNYVGDIIK